MARKKKLKIPPYVKYIVVGLLLIGLCIFVVNRTIYAFMHVDYFKVRSIAIDPSLEFINKRDLSKLVGKNIFAVDLKAVERRISHRYPQASHLRITRRLPDQISVVAKERHPFAQIEVQSKTVVLDKEGVILSLKQAKAEDLPQITGAKVMSPKLVLGLPLRGPDIWMTLKIINLFKAESALALYTLRSVDMESTSKINLTLTNKLEVIIDREKIAQKIKVLGVVLAQDQFKLKDVKYVDLRFKEPIIGKK